MTLEETLTQLEALGNEKMRAQNTKNWSLTVDQRHGEPARLS